MAWTDEMVADLKVMWADGLTTGEIAKRLGVSKNSIVGKVHRLGLSGRPSPIKKKVVTDAPVKEVSVVAKPAKKEKVVSEKKEEVKPVDVAPQKEKPIENVCIKEDLAIEKNVVFVKEPKKEPEFTMPKDGIVRLTDLDTHTCRWPIGDPKDEKFHFCGKKVKVGQTYCEEHAEIAYVKQTKR